MRQVTGDYTEWRDGMIREKFIGSKRCLSGRTITNGANGIKRNSPPFSGGRLR